MAYNFMVLACGGAGLALGYLRGFAVHASGLVALVLGFAVGIPLTSLILATMDETQPASRLLIFLGCFAAVTFVCHLIGVKIRSRLRKRNLQGWDRQLGAALGLLHGLFICLMLTFAAVVLMPSLKEPLGESASGRGMEEAFRAIHAVLPEEVQEGMQPLIERAESDGETEAR